MICMKLNKTTNYTNLWQPTANLSLIKQRAVLLASIREFFKQQSVLEIETPLLCQHAATSLHIDPIGASGRFLQTSPEYAMKRLLSAGSGDIFQLCKAFRGSEIGNLHNPEFTILEWYRVGFNHHQLITDVDNLLNNILSDVNIRYKINKISYREIFIKYLKLDPVLSSLSELKKLVINNIELSEQFKISINKDNFTKKDCQELLFSNCIEPKISKNHTIWFIYDYPVEQAELSNITTDQDGAKIAERFEVYVNGVEIANGYHELLDATLQKNRFLENQQMRQKLGKPHLEIDPYLIEALHFGMPNCSGVALGVDRLLMIKTQAKSIRDVLCFPWDVA